MRVEIYQRSNGAGFKGGTDSDTAFLIGPTLSTFKILIYVGDLKL
jgi:hypothetical protein